MANYIWKTYPNINALINYLDSFGMPKTSSPSGKTYDPEWSGSATYEEARERVLYGDKELAKKLRGSENLDINVPATGTRRKMYPAVCGFMPHVPNFIAGIPTSMIMCKEERVEKKVLDVYYGVNTHGDVSSEEITMVSARVMSCVMSMERKGYRINLYAVNCANVGWNENKYAFAVKIKDSGQHIDVLKMAMPMISSAWNRRIAFRFREVNGTNNMGSSVYGEELRSFLDERKVNYDVAMSFYDARRVKTVEELEKLFINSTKDKSSKKH